MLNPSEIDKLERQAIVAALFRICDPRAMENIKLGDTVQLKSGGPIMTVGGTGLGGDFNCSWFNGKELLQGSFYAEQLKPAKPREPEEPQGSQSFRTY